MKKKFIAFAAMAVLTINMATSAFATPAFAAAPRTPVVSVAGLGYCGGGYGIMWDQNGNFLDREAFEATLEKMIEEGYIRAEDKEYFFERYEWCALNGCGSAFPDREAFEANLDKLVEDGYIRAEDREYFLERYEWCVTYGNRTTGVRGGGRGMGCGMGRGW